MTIVLYIFWTLPINDDDDGHYCGEQPMKKGDAWQCVSF